MGFLPKYNNLISRGLSVKGTSLLSLLTFWSSCLSLQGSIIYSGRLYMTASHLRKSINNNKYFRGREVLGCILKKTYEHTCNWCMTVVWVAVSWTISPYTCDSASLFSGDTCTPTEIFWGFLGRRFSQMVNTQTFLRASIKPGSVSVSCGSSRASASDDWDWSSSSERT